MSDGELISELYAGCFRRLVVQLYAVTDAVRQPPLDDLRSAARSRRQRRSAVVALSLLVALAGTAVVPLAARSGGTDWAGPDQPPARPGRPASSC